MKFTHNNKMNRRSFTHRHGGALVEVALALSMLLALSFGAIEFGYCFFVKNAMANAATQGGWAAILPGATNSDVTNAVNKQMSTAGLANSGYTITMTPTDVSKAASGGMVTVQVSCIWGTAGQGFRPMNLIGSTKVVSSATSMRKEPG